MTENEAIEELSNELRMITGIISYCRDFENNNDLALAYRIKRQKAMEAAISALKEIQQYQEIGTVEECRNIILKHMNDGRIPVEDKLPEVFGKYWATIRYDDGRISEPIVVDFRGVQEKYVVDTSNGREYETWGIDSAFHGSRVIAWRPYYIPEPYRPERSTE